MLVKDTIEAFVICCQMNSVVRSSPLLISSVDRYRDDL